MTKAEYAVYLRSDHWRELKAEYKRRRRWKCACGAKKKLDLHHLTYDRLGHELLDDVAPLCRPCHHALHLGVKGLRASLRDVRYGSEGRALRNAEAMAVQDLLEREERRERAREIAKFNEANRPRPSQVPVDPPAARELAEGVAEHLGLELPPNSGRPA